MTLENPIQITDEFSRLVAADWYEEQGQPREAALLRLNVVVSITAVQRGFGSDRFKKVVFLTKSERAHIRAGGTVAFRSERLSGGNSGTYWRIIVDHGQYGMQPRVPNAELLKILD